MLLKARKTNKETKNACAPVSSGEPSSTGQNNPKTNPKTQLKKYPNCALKTSSQPLSGHNSNTASIHLYSNSQKQTEAVSCHPPLTSTLLTTDGEQVRLSPEREHI